MAKNGVGIKTCRDVKVVLEGDMIPKYGGFTNFVLFHFLRGSDYEYMQFYLNGTRVGLVSLAIFI